MKKSCIHRVNSESRPKFIKSSKFLLKNNNLSRGEINQEDPFEPSVNSIKKICLKKNNQTNILKIFKTHLKQKSNPFLLKKLQNHKKIIGNVKKSRKQLSPNVNKLSKINSKINISSHNDSNIFLQEKKIKQDRKSPNAGYNFYFVKINKGVKTANNCDDNRKTGTSSKDSDINKVIKSKKLFDRSKKIINEINNKNINSKK